MFLQQQQSPHCTNPRIRLDARCGVSVRGVGFGCTICVVPGYAFNVSVSGMVQFDHFSLLLDPDLQIYSRMARSRARTTELATTVCRQSDWDDEGDHGPSAVDKIDQLGLRPESGKVKVLGVRTLTFEQIGRFYCWILLDLAPYHCPSSSISNLPIYEYLSVPSCLSLVCTFLDMALASRFPPPPSLSRIWTIFGLLLPPLNFITIHYAYFISTCLVASLIFWGSSTPPKSVSYIDSLFLVVSAMVGSRPPLGRSLQTSDA